MAATGSLGTPQFLSNALSEMFEDRVVKQINRKSVFLQVFSAIPGRGKRVAWDIEEEGALADAYAEADDVQEAEYGVDEDKPATLSWGLYRAAFRVTGLAMAAAGTTDHPAELQNYWFEKMFGAVSRLGSVINGKIFIGTGSNHILGLYATAGALLDTGTYAGLDRSTETYFQGNVVGNSGTARPLSFGLMRETLREIYIQSGENVDVIMTDPIQWDKFAALFDNNRRWMQTVNVAGGTITLSGGHQALEFDGIPVLRDKDHPAGKMSFLNSNHVKIRYLPTRPNQPVSEADGQFQVHDDKAVTNGLPCRIEYLGKSGDTTKAFVKTYVQLQNRRPNATGALIDLS